MEQPRCYPTQPVAVTERMAHQIKWAVREVDPAQVATTIHLNHGQLVRQALSLIDVAQEAAAYHMHRRFPELSQPEALRVLRSVGLIGYLRQRRTQTPQEPARERR